MFYVSFGGLALRIQGTHLQVWNGQDTPKSWVKAPSERFQFDRNPLGVGETCLGMCQLMGPCKMEVFPFNTMVPHISLHTSPLQKETYPWPWPPKGQCSAPRRDCSASFLCCVSICISGSVHVLYLTCCWYGVLWNCPQEAGCQRLPTVGIFNMGFGKGLKGRPKETSHQVANARGLIFDYR